MQILDQPIGGRGVGVNQQRVGYLTQNQRVLNGQLVARQPLALMLQNLRLSGHKFSEIVAIMVGQRPPFNHRPVPFILVAVRKVDHERGTQ